MKRGFKTIIVFVLVIMMVFAASACTDKADDDASDATTKKTTEKTEKAAVTAEPEDELEFETVTWLTMGNIPTNGHMEVAMEAINEILLEDINCELELQFIEWADWQTQYNLTLAGQDPTLDLIGTATDWLNAWENTKKGSFMALSDEMIAKYAPITWSEVTEDHWDECRYEGDIYFFPEDQYSQWTNHGMFYRGDWAAEAGIDVVDSFEDLELYFDGVLANHPEAVPWDVSGSRIMAGLSEGYINAYTDLFKINGISAGVFAPFYVSQADPYTVICPYTEDYFEDFAVLAKSWAEKGFWREDVLNYDGETRDLMYAGFSGADQHHTQTYVTGTRPTMDDKLPDSNLQMYAFSTTSKNLVKDIVTHGACAISASSQHPERALMVYDKIRNESDLYRLFNYGVEGIDYIVTDDGKLDRPEGYDSTTMGLGTDFWWGRNDSLELDNVEHFDGKWELYDEYNSYAIDYPLGKFIFDKSSSETLSASIGEVCATYIPTIVWGKTDDPAAAIADFKEALEIAGLQDMLDEIQGQLDAYKAAN